MLRSPSAKAEVRALPVKVVAKTWQRAIKDQTQARPEVVDMISRVTAAFWAASTAACFSRRRMSLRSAALSGIRPAR